MLSMHPCGANLFSQPDAWESALDINNKQDMVKQAELKKYA
jgi:hypothetical protein